MGVRATEREFTLITTTDAGEWRAPGEDGLSSSPAVRSMRWLIGLLIVLPWIFVPGTVEPFLLPKMMIWFVGSMAFLVSALANPSLSYRVPFRNRWVTWIAVVVLVQTALRFWWLIITSPASDPQIPFNWFCVLPTISVCVGLLMMMTLATRVFPSFARSVRISQVLCAVAFSVAVYSLVQYLGYDQIFNNPVVINTYLYAHPSSSPLYMTAVLGNINYTSMYLALHLPLFLMFRNLRWLLYGVIVFCAVVLTGRLYGIVTAGISLTTYGWIRYYHGRKDKRWPLVVAGVLLVIGGSLLWWKGLPRLYADERFPIWRMAWADWKKQGLIGYGLGGFPLKYWLQWESVKPLLGVRCQSFEPWLWAHNDVLQWAYETGWFGVVPLVFAIGSTLRRAWSASSSVIGSGYLAAFVGMGAMSLMNFPWHVAPTALVCLVIWAMNETQEGVA